MIERIKADFERRGFEVCHRFGERLGIRPSRIRLFFIYASFVALGSPIFIYLALAFLLRLKDEVSQKRASIFDL
ncbi:PspC domain-containing protein [Phaeocystidibacter luteus]|uniref:PspC domain-containing protein n=1 Tax=Phaeocystidibacter luteus TaxID=911197 RepID=A0A6N6RF00_9FLAO|nr:PspC domain-containing protein [Phaeocystidibacter luteus]